MDMEVIQEFSENQCYLNALAQNGMAVDLDLSVIPASEATTLEAARNDSLSHVLGEPVGRLLFHAFLEEVGSLEYFLLLDVIGEYNELPPSPFRFTFAKKLIRNYLTPGARQEVSLDRELVRSVEESLETDGAVDGLFGDVERAVHMVLSVSSFAGFVQTHYYRRLVGFRLRELEPIERGHFIFLRVLGEGGFGKVFAVSKHDTNALYACKTMDKARIVAKKRQQLIMNERNILTKVLHPYIVTLHYAFQDNENLYLVQDLMSGGELGFHLSRFGKFPEEMARFYAAGMVLAIEYFHSRGIVYRDLKPENVMLDADGFIRLTDLGLCSFISEDEYLHQHCGTRSYMAPEQCYGEHGYQKEVDWWALGITIFYMINGFNPFSRRYRRRQRERLRRRARHKHARARAKRSGERILAAAEAAAEPANPSPAASAPPAVEMTEPVKGDTQPPEEEENDDDAEVQNGSDNASGDDADVEEPKPDEEEVDDDDVDRLATPATASRRHHKSVPRMARSSANKSTRTYGLRDAKAGTAGAANGQHRRNETPEARAERYRQLELIYINTLRDLEWPRDMSPEALSLCGRFMVMDPTTRLGHNGAEEVKAHPFFYGIDWKKLRERRLAPPFVPDRDYVNAKYVESATNAMGSSRRMLRRGEDLNFPGFDYTRPNTFQSEVIKVMNDRNHLGSSP